MIFAIKMILDNTYGLLNLFEFKSNHFNSLFQAEYDFKNSNFGGKYIEIMSSLRISRNTAFNTKYSNGVMAYFWRKIVLASLSSKNN